MESEMNYNLFSRINGILARQRAAREESRSRGEQFNMFHVCGVNHYEVTHSAILAELLDPGGSHGQKEAFLRSFLNVLGASRMTSMDFDTATAVVQTEYAVGEGRIDILITNQYRQALIIENKIYAGDQTEQLKRYDSFAERTYGKGNYVILYLTLFGGDASEQSSGGVDYVNVSYSKDILEWMNQCIVYSVSMPMIRETLIQYRNHIKELTNQNMETKYKKELLEAMAANAEAAASICNAQWEYRKYVVEEYLIPQLTALAKELHLNFKVDNLLGASGERGFYFYKEEWKRAAIWFYTERNSLDDFYWGISNYSGDKLAIPLKKLCCLSKSPNEGWPCGWEHLLQYKNWDMNTMADMINGKFVAYIKQNVQAILEELADKQLLLP